MNSITVSREPMEELVLYYTVPLSCRAQPQREDWMECLLDQRFWIGDDAGRCRISSGDNP
ncbi:hypothetical protein LC724_17980 [Blautia sp. RD014234]|nr:hypothetical protein [Blautia parvula]